MTPIQNMNISSKDINLLYLFKVVYEELNLSTAARRMSLSQPALSHRLNKLREEFNDEMFVRAARGLTPTPMARDLAPQILTLVTEIEDLFQHSSEQDFLDKPDIVRIYTTDLIEQLLLPKLLKNVQNNATHLQLTTQNTRGDLPKQEMERGICDIAIAGFFGKLPASFYEQKLCVQDFVVLGHRNNPSLTNGLTLDTYLANDHVITTLTGDFSGVVDKKLHERGLSRKVVAGVSSFLASPSIIVEGQYLLTCLRSLAEIACRQCSELEIHPCPITIPKITFVQCWHQRTHNDPLRKWLRRQIKMIFKELG